MALSTMGATSSDLIPDADLPDPRLALSQLLREGVERISLAMGDDLVWDVAVLLGLRIDFMRG